MLPYTLKAEDLAKQLSVNPATGLSKAEASQRLQQQGPNRITEKKRKSTLQKFFDQFKDIMIIILLAAAVISFVVACQTGEIQEFFEPLLILLIVILNAIMGVFQDNKAERALEALKGLSALQAKVLRDGQEQLIDAALLVPGDIIRLEAGDFVPADARLLSSASLQAEESALTGESVPDDKDATLVLADQTPLGDRENMIFSGCSITYGTGTAIVTATGMDTEMGKIAGLLESAPETQTPLQKKLADLGKYLGIAALLACAVIFAIGLWDGIPLMEIFMVAISLAVSAIPEGLPAIVTIVLAVGVQRMVKRSAIIKNLPAVETLGSASVICSDKTGTLTQNRMTLVKAYASGAPDTEDISAGGTPEVRLLLQYGALCCNGTVIFNDDGEQHIGDPTETAIVFAAHKNGLEKEKLNQAFPRLAEIPFDSDRKLMTTINKIDNKNIVIVKGAFDMLQTKCTAGDLARAQQINEKMGLAALRVLALAYKEIPDVPATLDKADIESNLTFLGLFGMIDPPRPEAVKAVAVCKNAGIKPVMITGDHVLTASAIARDLGILEAGGEAVSGVELAAMSDEELKSRVHNISVYARVSPEDKIRIVRAWQEQGEIVAMTGDGVNDAPALKAADIGCAMGITGTDVAKGAADMILTDDNFATIVEAVREGRGIYDNIKKVVGFLLGTNIGEVLAVFLAMLLWKQPLLLSMQLLWINLVTDSLPAIALGRESVETGVMNHRPKPKNEGIFAHGFGLQIFLQGCMFGALTIAAFYLGRHITGELSGGQTMAFIVLASSQIFQSFNMRSTRSLLKTGPFGNKKLNWAAIISFGLTALVALTPLAAAFELVILPASLYWQALALSFAPVLIMELSKAFGLIKHNHQD